MTKEGSKGKIFGKIRSSASDVIQQIKNRNTIMLNGKSNHASRFLVILNAYRQEAWEGAMEIYRYLRDKASLPMGTVSTNYDQDPPGKWTLKIVIKCKSSEIDTIKQKIIKKASEVHPSVGVKFEEILEEKVSESGQESS
jgi:hypothetical protein